MEVEVCSSAKQVSNPPTSKESVTEEEAKHDPSPTSIPLPPVSVHLKWTQYLCAPQNG